MRNRYFFFQDLRRSQICNLILSALIVITYPLSCFSEVISYTDDGGRTNFVDSIGKVPEKFRSGIKSESSLPSISRTRPNRKVLYENLPESKSPATTTNGRGRKKVEIFVASWCPYCRKLENYLTQEKIAYVRTDIESKSGEKEYKKLGGGGIPITRIGQTIIQGYRPEEIKRLVTTKR